MGCAAQQCMAFDHVVEAFGKQHVDGFSEREQQVHRRRAAVLAVMLFEVTVFPVPIRCDQVGILAGRFGFRPGGDKAQARRAHEAFLRAADGDIDAPGVHLERHAGE